ncbi:MAG: 30S ribosomal protein S12 methylthiotransferase RimO [Clostridia bacterium]|nr:30S ribosomal protein S12 methylthiotransferase RimO [Clostridia bacterium]
MTSIGVVSLGCSKNRVDTEQMLGLLVAAGYCIEPDPAKAQIIIVNTCGFIEPAKQESIDAILDMARYKKTGRCKLLLVTGCLSQRYAAELYEQMPEIDGLLGVGQYDRLMELIGNAEQGERPSFTAPCADFFEGGERVLTTPSYSAYVKIGEGCDNRCSYCAIPLIRGPYRSRPMAAILREMERLAERGVKEFTLVSQDTTRYGTDFGSGESQLPVLLQEAAALPGVEWLRALYCYPARVNEALLDALAALPNVCGYLDIPIQHIVPRLLTAMNRHGTAAHIRWVIQDARARNLALRTAIIVGFPGETEADFAELLDFVAQAKFDRLGAFAFSPEEDTPAAALPDQVPDEVKQERLDKLMSLQQGISAERNALRVGSACRVLTEGRRADGLYWGRSPWEAPEIDGHILFRSAMPLQPGDFATVGITDSLAYDLIGETV